MRGAAHCVHKEIGYYRSRASARMCIRTQAFFTDKIYGHIMAILWI